jgi:hypothetical protein
LAPRGIFTGFVYLDNFLVNGHPGINPLSNSM